MQTQGFSLKENSPTGMQIIPYAKVVCYHCTSVGHTDGHMDQVPNPIRPTPNCRSSLSISHYYFFSWNVLIKKTIPFFPSRGFFSHWSTSSFPKSLVTVESYSFLFSLFSRLIITNHCGSSDIHQLAVCPSSYVENFKILLCCSQHALRKKCNSFLIYSLKVSPLHLPIFCISLSLYLASDSAFVPPDLNEWVYTLSIVIPFKYG